MENETTDGRTKTAKSVKRRPPTEIARGTEKERESDINRRTPSESAGPTINNWGRLVHTG